MSPHQLSLISKSVNLGDGAYITKALKKYVEEECGAKLISPPKIKSKTGGTKFIGADSEANERCNKVGRDQWKDEAGYHKRSLVETNMFKGKLPFGDRLRCRTKENQIAEITIRAMILNIWTNKWMQKYTKPWIRQQSKSMRRLIMVLCLNYATRSDLWSWFILGFML